MSAMPHIRPAKPMDIPQIAQVNIQSWLETYPGIMPEQKLASLNIVSCTKNWEAAFDKGSLVFVAEIDEGICGFVSGGVNRPNDDCETGLADSCTAELAAMYILKAYHKRGVGTALFRALVTELQALGHHTMVAWVAEKNPACLFYEKMGGKQVDRRILSVCATPVPVLAYRYDLQIQFPLY